MPRLLRFAVGVVLAALPLTACAETDDGAIRGSHGGRAYRLYVPASVAPARPLVVALHGCWQTPEDFARGTRLDRAAGRRGLRVLYPAQDVRDNPARCWNWFTFDNQLPTSGEPAAILAMVREVQRLHRTDTDRLVVLGFSAGAYMAVNLTCAAPALVAGVGTMAGGPYRCADDVASGTRCMRGERLDGMAAAARCAAVTGHAPTARAALWQGEADSLVNPANHTALTTMFVRLAAMATGVTERRDGAVRTLYRAADGRPVVESWIVPGMGHAWSGGDPRGTHTYPAGPDATEAMLRFLVDE